uniref:Syntaphilin n=1 Tax=Hippocampus comes TaxID=109280 RepID=A0A3Q2XMF6_HIPCM
RRVFLPGGNNISPLLFGSRRSPAGPSNRDPYGNASLSSSSNSGSCKGSDCSPTKGRHQKYISCTDNHGIRPPPPEQYLTPLQQKEVCIRHLRARLKETINTLQDRDTEIDELREKLYKMQEDWVEEECHRVEAQLALKEARLEIQQLKQAVDTVRDRLSDAGGFSGDIGVQKYFQDINTQNHKLESLLLNMELAQVGLAKEGEAIAGRGIPKPAIGGKGSCSCDGSPARSLTRSSTYTKLSDQAANRNGNGVDFPCLSADGTQDSGFVCCGESSSVPSRADLLLEAAFLSEETASLLNSYAQTFSRSTPNSLPHAYSQTLPHSFPHNPSHSVPHTMPHSATYEKLCSGERMSTVRYDIDSITTTTSVTRSTVMSTATEPIPFSKLPQVNSIPRSATVDRVIVVGVHDTEDEKKPETEEQGDKGSGAAAEEADSTSDSGPVQKSYWSRHFLVDLLAVAIPVVPTVAWLCRGPVRDGQPMYHFGSLLRGCCTVALHSLRRGGGLRHYPAGGGDLGGSQM